LACGLLALALPGQARAATSQARAATSQSRAATGSATQPSTPWSKVGPGWSLVEYSLGTAGEPCKPCPTTLYLISPAGQRCPLDHWSPKGGIPSLLDWSG